MTLVCDIHELPDLPALTTWAHQHGTKVRYLGPTLEGKPVYGATQGAVTRVVVEQQPDPHTHPVIWKSPLERLEAKA
ncbi:hypothetical protein [Nocardiopsis synnemataformans]|uniref:hypothetical protein n=1 Tax=Nocardiopsis synnemataformans TaxID=61305 RepID=UPI003EBD9A09